MTQTNKPQYQAPLLEVCTGNRKSVMQAVNGGATRIELCANLELDGLTPDLETARWVRETYPQLTIHILIRSRAGNFVYTPDEIKLMKSQMVHLRPYADAFVIGALDIHGRVDASAAQALMDAAPEKSFTFHRAFDVCTDPLQALDTLIELGCARLLTSGQKSTAQEGIESLKTYVRHVGDRLVILAGGGVSAANAADIITKAGVREIHGSLSIMRKDGEKVTDSNAVRDVISRIKGL